MPPLFLDSSAIRVERPGCPVMPTDYIKDMLQKHKIGVSSSSCVIN